ncbi:monovalent cation/H+ antiporter subunit D [Sphingomonas carotinifaciens]|uniref:Monovalent cation/H+ antiporter subunit D n=1 Tax=Sphingomonas carotinifaciens TaxID=1166323 RepID=A0A1G7RQJ5_9SPHN|nr:monovalent cation/H+ antiporter subunit D [Sphingomonas carotinifaciens]MBB4088107.1 multicomponent K+:H+ antiporter subunit D [Sphingomonas carotinifaciens]MWC44821.1 monovalent cation/H+ antiporter subunit D [Sphingomonas carotinifaciens]SDG13048.1 multisubunit potassium/proton antiporter, PhaD subunit [Sphingomonas carotinifaciens]
MILLDHLSITPIVIPAVIAPVTMLLMRRHKMAAVTVSLAGCAAMLVAAIAAFVIAQDDVIRSYTLGGWPAPFGIVLILDRLAAMMLVLAAVLAISVLVHAIITGADQRGWHFHPLFHFQLMGLNGAFLTGDLFNLFVFFEVLLIASYGLMLHGQGALRLKAGVAYVVVNIVGSALFLIALGLLYGLTATLNMADLAVKVVLLGPADQGLLRIAGLLLMTVFGLKAAVVPIHLWLPRTYAATMPVVAALFAIMTKVGVYAMIRTVPLIFGAQAGAASWVPAPYLLPAAILGAVIGFVGILTARGMREQAAFAVLASTGTLLMPVSLWQEVTLAAALYYLVQATLAGAALFLVADVTMRRRGQYADAIVPSPHFAGQDMAGLLYLVAAIAAVGLPPLAGFVGKLLILDASFGITGWQVIWATILATTLVGVIGFSRSGSTLFWKAAPEHADAIAASRRSNAEFVAPIMLLAMLVLLTIAAGWVTTQTRATAVQVMAPDRYVTAILGATL